MRSSLADRSRTARTAFLAAAVLLIVPALVVAQPTGGLSRWSAELSGDAAIPTSDLGDAALKTGFGIGANVRARLQPHLFAYAGWEWHRFTSDELEANETIDAEETGYTLGLLFAHAFRGEQTAGLGRASGAGYWLRAGALVNHIELENEAGDRIADTKHGVGYEVGAGLTLPFAERLALTPGVRFRSLSRDLTLNAATRSVTLSYVTVGTGVTISF